MPTSTPMRDHHKSRHPMFGIPRRHEPVAADWVPSNTPAVDNGENGARVFIGTESHHCEASGAKTDAGFCKNLESNIRKHGAMDKLITDRAQSEVSHAVHDLLNRFIIPTAWQSEPGHQNQNILKDYIMLLKQSFKMS